MFAKRNEKKVSLAIFFMIIFLGCIGLFLKYQSPLLASFLLKEMKVHIVVIRETAGNLNESDLKDPDLREMLREAVIEKYKHAIFHEYYPETEDSWHKLELIHTETWLDSLRGNHFVVARYDFMDDVRAISLIDVQHDSLICINAFRKGSMIPYTFGPLAKKARELLVQENVRI